MTRSPGTDDLKEIELTLLINNRVSKGRLGMADTTAQSQLNAGDFDTPEQRVGEFNRKGGKPGHSPQFGTASATGR